MLPEPSAAVEPSTSAVESGFDHQPPPIPDSMRMPASQALPEKVEEVLHFIKKKGRRHNRPLRFDFSARLTLLEFFVDFFVIFWSMVGAWWIRYYSPIAIAHVGAPPDLQRELPWIVCGVVLYMFLLSWFGAHDHRFLLRFRPMADAITKAAFTWILVYPGLNLLIVSRTEVSRSYFLWCLVMSCGSLLCWRFIFQAYLASSSVARRLRKRVLFLGWSEEANALAEAIARNRQHPFEVVGTNPFNMNIAGEAHELAESESFLELEFVLAQDVVDMVIAASPDFTQKSLQIVANLCEKWLVEFKIAPSCFQIFVSGLSLESISGVPVLGVSRLPLDVPLNAVLKRLADLVGGLIGLLVSLPIIAVFVTLLYLEDAGPVFFPQERRGRGGRKFRMFKLRSMRMGADASDHLHQSTQREDPRILAIGAFMRRWNIDETPQFWNVLKGEMSLVGPRPERTFHSEALSNAIPHYNARYNSLPGMTGWAQVNGLRGDTDMVERIKCDLYYIENWSLLLDFQIIMLTLSRNRNAY